MKTSEQRQTSDIQNETWPSLMNGIMKIYFIIQWQHFDNTLLHRKNNLDNEIS